jgi:hypothetical protein
MEQVTGTAVNEEDASASEPDTELSDEAEDLAVAQVLTGSLPSIQTETQIESTKPLTQ